jgi:hypothetical protein
MGNSAAARRGISTFSGCRDLDSISKTQAKKLAAFFHVGAELII